MIEADITVDEELPDGFTFGHVQALRHMNNCYISKQSITGSTYSTPWTPSNSLADHTASKQTTHSSPPSSSSAPFGVSDQNPTIFATTPTLFDTDVLDFSKMIRNKYKGQVGGSLLDDLKLHNARCLQHLHKYYRGLTAAIIKENSILAVKYMEHHNRTNAIYSTRSTTSNSEPRCKTPDDMLSAPGSGNEEDNSRISKTPRLMDNDLVFGKTSNQLGWFGNSNCTTDTLAPTSSNPYVPLPQVVSGDGALQFDKLLSSSSVLHVGAQPCPQAHSATKPYAPKRPGVSGDYAQQSVKELLPSCHTSHQPSGLLFETPVNSMMMNSIASPHVPLPQVVSGDGARQFEKLLTPFVGSHAGEIAHISKAKERLNDGIVIGKSLDQQESSENLDSPTNTATRPTVSSVPCPQGHSATKPYAPLPAGTSGDCSRHSGKKQLRSCHTSKQSSALLFETPVPSMKMGSITPTCSPTTENKLFAGVDLSLKILSSIKDIDMNDKSFEAQYRSSPVLKKDAKVGSFATSHWEMGLDHPLRDNYTTHRFFEWLSSTNSDELDRCWIMHDSPRFIQIKGDKIQMEWSSNHFMSDDVFDIAIRRMKQLDQALYPSGIHSRWRHFFESDFVFFVPVFANGIWWCYAWDLKNNKVFIIDPLTGPEKDELVLQRHCGTINMLKKSLTQTVMDPFNGWNPTFNNCTTSVFRTPSMPCPRSQTGLFTLFCIRNFDGTDLTEVPSELNMLKFKEYLLHEMLELEENRARLPAAFVHTLD